MATQALLRKTTPLGLAEAQRRVIAEGKLRIVAHNGADIVGGAERALIALLQGLQGRGHQVSLACNHEIVAEAAVRRLVPAIVMPLRGDLVFGDVLRFAKFLSQEQPDAFVVGTFKKIWLAGMAARRAGLARTIARVGLSSDTPRRWKYRYALMHWTDSVVLTAESMRAEFLAGVPRFPEVRVVTIRTGVVMPVCKKPPGTIRRTLNIPPDAPTVGAVARLSRQKRLERLLEVTAALPGVHCIIAGSGSEQQMLEERARSSDLNGRVHLLGERSDIGDILAALDVFVITSDQEGLSNAMLEALSSGVPIVSTPVSGAHEALEPSVTAGVPGVVTKSYEVAELQRAVARVLDDAPTRAGMAQAARAIARERFDFERMLDDWEVVLRGNAPDLNKNLRTRRQ